MKKTEAFRAFRSAIADPERIGDAAVYKSELGGARARPEIEARVRSLAVPFPHVELEPLRSLPRGTLGREYAELLHANDLQPFRLSDRLEPEVLERNLFMARYALLHDVVHVLTGFDTSWSGEAGVWGFVAGQGYRWTYWLAALMACAFYPLATPLRTLRIWRNTLRGIRMGRRAHTLITMPLETMWERPVDELRDGFRIEPASELAIPTPSPAAG